MKFWFCLCLLFFGYTIVILMSERFEVNYQLEDKNESIYYSVCYRLTDMFKNKEIIDLDQLNYDLYKIVMSHIANVTELNKRIFDLLLNEIKFKRYFIYREHVCLSNDTVEFYRIKSQYAKIKVITIEDLEYPFTRCSKRANHFSCLAQCVKSVGQRFSKYYFKGHEHGHVYLRYQMNKTTLDNEFKCVEKCRNQIPCKFANFQAQYYIGYATKESKSFIAYASITGFDYWFQFISLICLILNVSSYQLMYKLVIILALKFKSLNAYLESSRKLITLPNLLLSFYLFTSMSRNYLERRDSPIRREITTTIILPEPLSLVICINIFEILDEDYEYENITYFEVEKILESRFDPNAARLRLEFFNARVQVKWHWLRSKVLFYGLFRCYILEVNPIESSNYNLFFLSRLAIELKFEGTLVYILPETNYEFNSRSLEIDPRYSMVKRVIKRSKLNSKKKCLDYIESKENCSSRWSCIDQCANRLSFSLYQSISDEAIVSKDQFEKEIWATLEFNTVSGRTYEKRHKELLSSCEKKYEQLDCTEITFEYSVLIKDPNEIEDYQLDLNYDIISLIEEEPSIIVVVMDILNLNIILFGVNFFKLISTAFNHLRIRFKCQKLFIYFVCTIGLVSHLWFVWTQIVNSDLIYSQFFISPIHIHAPDLLFCCEKSNKLKLENLFDKIIFLDKHTNEWESLKFINSNQTEFKVEKLFFLNQKCLRIVSNMEYNRDQFEFAYSTSVLKIFFNKTIIYQQDSPINFLTKNKNTNQFSKVLFLLFKNPSDQIFMTNISHESYQIIFEDKFSFIRNPFAFFYGQNSPNADELLKIAIDGFKRRHYVRKRSRSLNKEIEKLFDTFIYQVQDVSPRFESKCKKEFAINYLNQELNVESELPDFVFDLIYFKRVVFASNSENLTKLILNIMSLFEFWYFANFLNFYVYLYKIRDFFIYLKSLVYKSKFLAPNV